MICVQIFIIKRKREPELTIEFSDFNAKTGEEKKCNTPKYHQDISQKKKKSNSTNPEIN